MSLEDFQKNFNAIFGDGKQVVVQRREVAYVYHGMFWRDTTANRTKVRCDHHNTWHVREEVRAECNLETVIGALPR